MKIRYGCRGIARKRLALQLGEYLQVEVSYRGSPGYEYDIDPCVLDKDGTLDVPDELDARRIVTYLMNRGFTGDFHERDVAAQPLTDTGFTVSLSKQDFTLQSLDNLRQLLDSKASLIKKALGINALPMLIHTDSIVFPWFAESVDAETAKAIRHFVTALGEMARAQKNIRAVERPVENEKYAFRCFLLRLGFIGDEYREERKTLLSRLTGSAAFKKEDKS